MTYREGKFVEAVFWAAVLVAIVVGFARRIVRAVRRWLDERTLTCGCCWRTYREHAPRPCGCAPDPSDRDACVRHGR